MDKHDLLSDRNGVSVKNPCTKLDPIRVRRRVKEWLSQDELDRLVNAARTPEQAFLIRWYALTGARAREGSHVRLADVDLSGNGRILIPGSKTDAAVRPVPVHRELRPHLELRVLRMQAAGMESSTPILHTRNRRSITEQQAHRWVREVAERAHLGKRVNPQMLRRTFGSILINQGMRLEAVSKLLGHSSTKVTETYYAELLAGRIEQEFHDATG